MRLGASTPASSSAAASSGDAAQRAALTTQITNDVVRSAAITAITNIAADPTKNGPAVQTDATNAAQAAAQAAYDLKASLDAHQQVMTAMAQRKASLQAQLRSLGGRA